MNYIQLKIIGLANSESQPHYYTLLFEEIEGKRQLPVLIGGFEAQFIARHLENKPPDYHHIYDLYQSTLLNVGGKITAIEIKDIIKDNFQTTINGLRADGTNFSEKARTGDAIAIGLRSGCPIYVSEKVMEMIGVIIEASGKVRQLKNRKLSEYSIPELENELGHAVEQEEYEQASKIRDLIQERKGAKKKNKRA